MGIFVYVGNLGSTTTEDSVRKAFVAAGNVVQKVVILKSTQTGRSRGFGFVEMSSEDAATSAIQTLNGIEVDGRKLKVSTSRERAPQHSGRSFESYSGLGGRTPGGPRRTGGANKRKRRS